MSWLFPHNSVNIGSIHKNGSKHTFTSCRIVFYSKFWCLRQCYVARSDQKLDSKSRFHSEFCSFAFVIQREGAPRQMKIIASCCFANSLLQNIVSSVPMRNATLNTSDKFESDFPCMVFDFLKKTVSGLYLKEESRVLDSCHISFILHWMDNDTATLYKYGEMLCPLQFFQYILQELLKFGHEDHPLFTEIFTPCQIKTYRMCSCSHGVPVGSL